MSRGERFNAITHLIGAVLTVLGMILLISSPLMRGEIDKVLAFGVYGMSLLAVFTSSILFHSTRGKTREIFRRYDRVAIYLLIAGTYTPLALFKLPPVWGRSMLAFIWTLVFWGAVSEYLVARNKKKIAVSFYLILGWLSILVLKPLLDSITLSGVIWFFGGGVLYSLGALLLRLKLHPRCHEIWHVVVLAASACHFAVMLLYVS